MSLERLTPDCFRILFEYLDDTSLVRLGATFNRAIQLRLFSPGMMTLLCLTSTCGVKTGDMRYFLRSIRDVYRLVIRNTVRNDASDQQWPMRLTPLLSSINPTHLAFESTLFSISAQYDQLDSLKLTLSGLPNLAFFTPRLQSLDLKASIMNLTKGQDLSTDDGAPSQLIPILAVPPCLLTFNVEGLLLITDEELIMTLPSTLTSLSITKCSRDLAIQKYLARFQNLEHLHIGCSNLEFLPEASPHQGSAGSGTVMKFPSTLRSFHVTSYNYPHKLLENLVLLNSSLEHFGMQVRGGPEQSHTDLHALLPSTLTSAEFRFINVFAGTPNFVRLPMSLTRLKIDLDSNELGLFACLASLPCLSEVIISISSSADFSIISTKEAATIDNIPASVTDYLPKVYFHFGMLPSSTKKFTFARQYNPMAFPEVNAEHFGDMPKSLTSLSVPCFTLWNLAEFRKHFPSCLLTISDLLYVWEPEIAAELRSKFASQVLPSLDVAKLISVAEIGYRAEKVLLTLSSNIRASKSFIEDSWKAFSETKSLTFETPPPRLTNIREGHQFCPFPLYAFIYNAFSSLQELILRLDTPERLIERFGRLRNFVLCFDHLPPDLTHLELLNVPTTSKHRSLPPSLTFISSNTPYSQEKILLSVRNLSNLIHLDTPLWQFDSQNLSLWARRDMEKLSCSMMTRKNGDVVQMMEKTVTQKTLENMHITPL